MIYVFMIGEFLLVSFYIVGLYLSDTIRESRLLFYVVVALMLIFFLMGLYGSIA